MTTKLVISLLVLFFSLPCGYAAIVQGNIYDTDLHVVHDVIVHVNSSPEQTFVAKDGSYSFTLPVGCYVITATHQADYEKFVSQQNITIKDDGEYVSDMILFPDISEEERLLDEEVDLSTVYGEEHNTALWAYGWLVVLIVVGSVYLVLKRKRRNKRTVVIGEDLLEEVVAFITDNGGRVTQKDIRKHFPVSEAKISLVTSELEEKGVIKKIKKGKGNIIILRTRS